MKKSAYIAGLAVAVGATGLIGVSAVSAATTTNPQDNLVSAIASKFNLDKTKVQAVFDEQRDAMHAEREAERKQALSTLITEGKLTQKQVDAINAKHAELEKEREANKGSLSSLTHDERHSKMKEKRTELEAWAKENDIPTEYLRYVMGGGRGHGPGHMMRAGSNDAN